MLKEDEKDSEESRLWRSSFLFKPTPCWESKPVCFGQRMALWFFFYLEAAEIHRHVYVFAENQYLDETHFVLKGLKKWKCLCVWEEEEAKEKKERRDGIFLGWGDGVYSGIRRVA